MLRYTRSSLAASLVVLVLVLLPTTRAHAQGFFENLIEGLQDMEDNGNYDNGNYDDNDYDNGNNPRGIFKLDRPGTNDYDYDYDNGFDNGYNNNNNNNGNYFRPQQGQRRFTPLPQNTPIPVEEKPIAALGNPVQVSIRPATKFEVDQVRKDLAGIQEDLVADLEDVLEDSLPKTARLIANLESRGIASDIQAQVLQAVKTGNADQVQILWTTHVRDAVQAEELYRRVVLTQSLNNIRDNAGDITSRDLRALRRAIEKAGLEVDVKKEALTSATQLESTIGLVDGVVGTAGEVAGRAVALPSGAAEVLSNPKLAAGTVVELSPGRYMMGGGTKLEMRAANLAAGLGYAVLEGSPVSSSDAKDITSGVVLRSSRSNTANVAYRLVNQSTGEPYDYTIGPNQSQHILGAWTVEFDRSGGRGTASYGLSGSTYEFRYSADKGWELYSLEEFGVTLDNSANRFDFQFVMNNKPQTVRAGETKKFTSPYPPTIRYLRASTGTEKIARLDGGTTYRVGLFTGDGAWDIFPATAIASASGAGGSGGFTPAP